MRYIGKKKSNPLKRDKPLLRKNTWKLVPIKYYNFLNIFSKVDSNILPPQRKGIDYRIDLEPRAWPEDLYYSLLYKILLKKLKVY